MSFVFINELGISELLSRILAACGSVDYLIFACLAYFVIERYGRRKVMMCSAAACSICWIGIAIALGLSERGGDSYVLGSVAVAFFFLFFASFGMGYGIPRNCQGWDTLLTWFAVGLTLSTNILISARREYMSISLTYPTGVLGVPWLYPTEINALEMRTKGMSYITIDTF
jgi:MFS family permease